VFYVVVFVAVIDIHLALFYSPMNSTGESGSQLFWQKIPNATYFTDKNAIRSCVIIAKLVPKLSVTAKFEE